MRLSGEGRKSGGDLVDVGADVGGGGAGVAAPIGVPCVGMGRAMESHEPLGCRWPRPDSPCRGHAPGHGSGDARGADPPLPAGSEPLRHWCAGTPRASTGSSRLRSTLCCSRISPRARRKDFEFGALVGACPPTRLQGRLRRWPSPVACAACRRLAEGEAVVVHWSAFRGLPSIQIRMSAIRVNDIGWERTG